MKNMKKWSRAKVCAFVACILFTILTVLGLFTIGSMWASMSPAKFAQTLNLPDITAQQMNLSFAIASAVIFIICLLNWLSFIFFERKTAWRRYVLVIGIFYLLGSMFNGSGLILTLPIGLAFLLAFIFSKQ